MPKVRTIGGLSCWLPLVQVDTGISKYMRVPRWFAEHGLNLIRLTVRLFVQLDAAGIYVETAYPLKCPATRFVISRDGPSISELSKTRPCKLELSLLFAAHNGMPQTNNGVHNENQYSYEWTFNTAIERWITSFTVAVNQARKFVGEDTSEKRESDNYYRYTRGVAGFCFAESWYKILQIL